MDFRELPLPDGSYSDTAKSFADQAVINYLAEYSVATGTRAPKKLTPAPGGMEWLSIGDGPHRGGRDVEGTKFIVTGGHAYRVRSATDVVQIGDIPGRGLVWITHNKRNGGNQVLFSTGPDSWIYDTVDQSWMKISDPAFVGFIAPDYIGHKFVGIGRSREFFYNSALEGQDDGGLSYNDLERYEAESSPDGLKTLLVANLEVLVFGERTIEPFTDNVSTADLANHILFRNKLAPIPYGCASQRGACLVGGIAFFVSSDGHGRMVVGYGPEGAPSITPPPIVQAWAQCDLTKCFTFAYESGGHLVWYVTFPDGGTWGYDLVASKIAGRPIWHQRQSKGMKRWRLNTLFKSGADWFGGACDSGLLYKLDWDYMREGCDEIRRVVRTGVRHGQGNLVRTGGVRVTFDSGSAETACSHVTPIVPEILMGSLYVASATGLTCPSYYKVNTNTNAIVVSGPDTDAFINGWVKSDGSGLWGVQALSLAFGFYDFATDTFTTLNSAHTYGLFVVDSTETYAYVQGDFPASVLYKIRLSDGNIMDSESYTGAGIALVIDADDAHVYTHGYSSSDVSVYNIAAGTMVSNFIGIGLCRDSCLGHDETYFYSVCVDGLAVPYLAKYLTADLPNPAPVSVDFVAMPGVGAAVRCNPDGLTVAVSSYGGSSVWIYDVATLTAPPVTIAVGSSPNFLLYRPDGKRLFVICADSDNCKVIDTEAGSPTVNTVIDTISLPVSPGRPSYLAPDA